MSTLTRGVGEAPAHGVSEPPQQAASSSRPRWLWPAAAALVIAAAIATYLATRPAVYHYRLDFSDAGQLVKGDLIRIGGSKAGTVNTIGVTPDGQAQIGISVDRSFGPLRAGTTATIRQQGLIGVANRYIDVSPAPTFKPALRNNATIPSSQTTSIVEIDSLFDTFDANTRQGLQRLIRGFGAWYAGKSTQANLSAQYFPPALQSYTQLFSQIGADSNTLSTFLNQTASALGSIDLRRAELTDLVTQAHTTASALGADNTALSQALTNLPGALRSGSATFARLRTDTLPALQHLVDVSGPATRHLDPFLHRLQPVLNEAVPNFALLRQMFDQPGPNNDLYDALTGLPPLARQVSADFPHAQAALNQSTPVFAFARPYVPDLVGWVSNWSGVFAPYDANGHYARTVPVFDAFSFSGAGSGGSLTPKPPSQRGSGGALQTGFLHRCPGAAIVSPTDHSAPFYDTGPLANPNCRASETIGGTP